MQIFEAVYNLLKRVGMNSHQSNERHPFNLKNSTSLFILIIDIFSTVIFLINKASNLREYADSIYLIISLASAALNFAYVNWKMAEIFRFIDDLEDIINTRLVNPTLKTIYKQISENIQKISEITYSAMVKMTPVFVTVPTFIGSFVAYFSSDLGTDAFELPFPIMWFPFDVKIPFGYTVAVALQFTSSINLNLTIACVLIIVIAPCLTLISTTDDMKYGLSLLNTSARTNDSKFKITQQFNRFVQFHSKAKRLVNDFSEMVEFVFMVHFTWSIGSICLTMFAIKIELREHAPESIILQSFILLIYSFALVFLSCEFGHKLSNAFDEIDHEIGQLYWYKFPTNLWKLLPILRAGTQEPAYLRVFGSKSCARGDFQGVVNCGFSYFMVLQKFENRN